jgi:hypothetical protein
MISSRVSHLALNVNIGALSGPPRPYNPSNKSGATSPTNAGGLDAIQLLASQVQALSGPDLSHVSHSS